MALPTLPAQGDTSWYDWAKSVDEATLRGPLWLDSFQNTAGNLTDEQLLTDAFAYMQAQTYAPTLMLGPRLHTFTTTRVPFNGMRISGVPSGMKNPEISNFMAGTRVQLDVGIGTSSWMNGNGAQRRSIYIGDISFTASGTNTQFWEQSVNDIFPATFHSLAFLGFKHVFGQPAAKALMTLVSFTGVWLILSPQDVQISVGGSDNLFWCDGRANVAGNNSVAGNDRYLIHCDFLDKTTIGAGLYITAQNDWRGIKVLGSDSYFLNFVGCILEGQNAGDPCFGNIVRIQGANVNLNGIRFAHGMSSPTAGENGIVEVTGGDVTAIGCGYERATGVAETVPMFYCSGGRCSVKEVKKIGSWTGLPRVDEAGGTVPATDGTWTLI